MTALEDLLAQVSDAELEAMFEEAIAGAGDPASLDQVPWYCGAEIRERIRTRSERRQAMADAELVVPAA